MNTDQTIFEKIIAGEVPCTKIYENDDLFAFLDINPVHKGHTLLITKQPFPWIQEVPDELLAKAFVATKPIINSMKQTIGCDYVQVSVVGKDVPHFHIHLIPRWLDDNVAPMPHAPYESPAEQAEYAAKIISGLA